MKFYRTWDVILDKHSIIKSKEVDAFVVDRFPDSFVLNRKEKEYKFHGISEGIHLVVQIEVIDGKRYNSIYLDDDNINSVNALLDTVGYGMLKNNKDG
tara:strand:+ start:42092 stop:42385 length:294 start_codon:yes stop_codon:yes gene_type:complete